MLQGKAKFNISGLITDSLSLYVDGSAGGIGADTDLKFRAQILKVTTVSR
jgi:hypothetical protein